MKVHSSGTLNNARVHKPRSPALRVVRILLLSVLIAHCVYIFVTGALIFIYKFTNPPTTFLMIYRSLVNRWDVQKPIPLQTSQIPSYLRRMLVSVEDGKFYDHHGIDMEAFKRARDLNQKIGRPMYGGSTITMQVARTLFLLPNKSYLRKYLEVIAALEMEVILSKARILELYFGYAEWGKGIFGIERASRLYYGKGVASIQVDQAARLIALLSSPIKYRPDTLYRSLILRERYEFLVRRYVAPVAAAAPSPETPPGGLEPSADISSSEDIASPELPGDGGGSPTETEPSAGTSTEAAVPAEDAARQETSSQKLPPQEAAPSPALP
jgi:monofunctional biosynthetic peptidoglycan transglycosylase